MNVLHKSVLKDEVLDFFKTINGTYIDATLGCAGHSYEILKNNKNLKLIGIDRDVNAIKIAKEVLTEFSDRVSVIEGKFSEVTENINFVNISAILADIGISSLHVDNLERGFSFKSDNLDMRMGHNKISAYDVINTYSKDELNRILLDYGEIKNFKYYTDVICSFRKKKEITSAKELCSILSGVKSKNKTNPLTQLFQAIRIEVNGELDELKSLLENIEKKAESNTLIAIITFHSLEDRIVKEKFKIWSKNCICSNNVDRCTCGGNNSRGKVLTKKPIVPTSLELKENSRSRSAKLRVFKFNYE